MDIIINIYALGKENNSAQNHLAPRRRAMIAGQIG
jgi:hypothetical protein